MPMYPEYKKKWVDVLRSKKYEQGKGRLNDGHGHLCVLGVPCEELKDELELTVVSRNDRSIYYEGNLFVLPKVVYETLGLEENNPFIPTGSDPNPLGQIEGGYSLTGLNDEGMSFEQLADVIDYFL